MWWLDYDAFKFLHSRKMEGHEASEIFSSHAFGEIVREIGEIIREKMGGCPFC